MTMTSYRLERPSGYLLLIIHCINLVCTLFNFDDWQDHLPFGLGDPSKNGWLSHELPPSYRDGYLEDLPSYSDYLSEVNEKHSMSNLYKYCFETNSTALGVLTSSHGLIAIGVVVLIMRQIKAFSIPAFCNFGRRVGRSTHGAEWEKENEERIIKFGEYVFRLFYHSSVAIFGIWYFWDKPWWNLRNDGQKLIFIGYPNHVIETGMIWYYIVQSAYNVEALISLAELSFTVKLQSPVCPKGKMIRSPVVIGWSPTCRGDFREMAIHHLITNMLILGSSYCRFTIVGSMLLLIHDISDVPVDLSKLANFMKWKNSTILCFTLVLISWLVTRLGVLPFVILETIQTDSKIVYEDGPIDQRHHDMYIHGFFRILVTCLLGLHIFWYFILIRIGYRLVTKGERHDLTEHKNGEEVVHLSSAKKAF